MLQNKETTAQNYRKISNESSKKSHGIEFALFSGTGVIGMDNFGYLNNTLYFISILWRSCEILLWRTYAFS